MKTLNEFFDFLSDFNPVSKKIMKIMAAIVFLLVVGAMYFALAAGRTEEYYISMWYFEVLIENIKSVLGLGFFFALLFEPVYKKFTVE
ncbi:MAG: hypothetical protein E7523_03970 [Ruminococcaceae bacterium]|nr:hypothetical protein [Oscillospiraceae bacterium]